MSLEDLLNDKFVLDNAVMIIDRSVEGAMDGEKFCDDVKIKSKRSKFHEKLLMNYRVSLRKLEATDDFRSLLKKSIDEYDIFREVDGYAYFMFASASGIGAALSYLVNAPAGIVVGLCGAVLSGCAFTFKNRTVNKMKKVIVPAIFDNKPILDHALVRLYNRERKYHNRIG